jgi:hypothetical protein
MQLYRIWDNEHRIGYISRQGIVMIEPQFERAGEQGDFSEDRAVFFRNRRYGYIDTAGNECIPAVYELAKPFYGGRAWVKTDTGWCLIDRDGNQITKAIYYADTSYGFFAQFSWLDRAQHLIGGRYGFIDRDGRESIPFVYDYVRPFSNGVAWVHKAGEREESLIGTDGTEIFAERFASATQFSEGLCAVTKVDGTNWWINLRGEDVFRHDYAFCGLMLCGRASVKKGRKYGYIDGQGIEVINCEYTDATSFTSGLALVRKNRKWQLIDRLGNAVGDHKFDGISDHSEFDESLLCVEENGNWGFIGLDGSFAIQPRFLYPSRFVYGLAEVDEIIDGRYVVGYVDPSGNYVWQREER